MTEETKSSPEVAPEATPESKPKGNKKAPKPVPVQETQKPEAVKPTSRVVKLKSGITVTYH